VDELGALAARATAEVVALDNRHAEASRCSIQGDAGPGSPAADDKHVVLGTEVRVSTPGEVGELLEARLDTGELGHGEGPIRAVCRRGHGSGGGAWDVPGSIRVEQGASSDDDGRPWKQQPPEQRARSRRRCHCR